LGQADYSRANLKVLVTDNASKSQGLDELEEYFGERITIRRQPVNLGYCGGHNAACAEFLASTFDVFLVLNPDLMLMSDVFQEVMSSMHADSAIGTATIKLRRADENLNPLVPETVDAAGMIMTSSLRHFDRGSGEPDGGTFTHNEFVFAGTGACLFMKRAFVEDALLRGKNHEDDVLMVYPELRDGLYARAPLFDESFFAYREDAELGWRAQTLGWKCLYVGNACGHHVRVVTPERRKHLPALLNRLSVRNRFLMQAVHFSPVNLNCLISGFLIRNLIVIIGVLLFERASFGAFKEVALLWRRSMERRRILKKRRRVHAFEVMKQFTSNFHE